ncbi:hypothetical protein BABINDRAFT_165325 [Babjeviella inositovora NRRL Y-12698]|uniref:Uncharacterized protein n=1 Tax=Babjeviella inositovora NRRL Y-12698 TaxID=984486 RepID=A0A1E3QW74_9ASCO|nr:uncharacterized protein BABINDRAFT_165325 [Babjeviella inositovora NRRL Y-12698]ODQ81804.1 hypothetical protein BABINDRAFT_165325 [Babjeviella inositovora NRRL Y-12698]
MPKDKDYLIVRSKNAKGYDYSTSVVLPEQPVLPAYVSDKMLDHADYQQLFEDVEGEKKISSMGVLLGGRSFKFNSFQLPSYMSRTKGTRDDSKMFLLASDLAPILNYRDAHHLFKKNKQLNKILTEARDNDFLLREKLISPKIVGKRLSAVTARSVYLVFGARVIIDGVRIRDDYWESEFKKQGFTEKSPVDTRKTADEIAHSVLQKALQAANAKSASIGNTPTQSAANPGSNLHNNQSFQLQNGELSLAQLFPLAENPKFVNLQPDERAQYLETQQHTLVYPGQGFINSFEVNSLLKVPQYMADSSAKDVKKNSTMGLSSAALSAASNVFLAISNEFVKIPVSEKYASKGYAEKVETAHYERPRYAVNGLPYFNPAIKTYVKAIPEEKLAVIELQHSTLHLNKLMQYNRRLRNKSWHKYYRQKAGSAEVKQDEFLEARYEGETTVEVVKTQKRMNGNALGRCNIKRVRPIYEPEPERVRVTAPVMPQNGFPLRHPHAGVQFPGHGHPHGHPGQNGHPGPTGHPGPHGHPNAVYR